MDPLFLKYASKNKALEDVIGEYLLGAVYSKKPELFLIELKRLNKNELVRESIKFLSGFLSGDESFNRIMNLEDIVTNIEQFNETYSSFIKENKTKWNVIKYWANDRYASNIVHTIYDTKHINKQQLLNGLGKKSRRKALKELEEVDAIQTVKYKRLEVFINPQDELLFRLALKPKISGLERCIGAYVISNESPRELSNNYNLNIPKLLRYEKIEIKKPYKGKREYVIHDKVIRKELGEVASSEEIKKWCNNKNDIIMRKVEEVERQINTLHHKKMIYKNQERWYPVYGYSFDTPINFESFFRWYIRSNEKEMKNAFAKFLSTDWKKNVVKY